VRDVEARNIAVADERVLKHDHDMYTVWPLIGQLVSRGRQVLPPFAL